jgi:prepilin signal peptidase PulO-like enzyme (type II secretory pathway)
MLILVIFLGWISGIFTNYIADVLPAKRRLEHPFCLYCEQPQPLTNYLFWPRKCPNCQKKRSLRTWIVEAFFISSAIWLWYQTDLVMGFWLSLIVITYFGIVVVIDLEHHLIMHLTSIFGALLAIIIGILLHGPLGTLLGGLAGFGLMLSLYILGVLFARFVVRRSQSGFNDEALGFGDVILGGILGLLLGWPAILGGLFFSIIFAGIISILYLLVSLFARKYRAFSFIPYGPFMVAGAVVVIFFNQYFVSTFAG